MYDPDTETWVPTGSMMWGRAFHTATLLTSGKVLVTGGQYYANTPDSSAELYDPDTGTWQETGSMATAREKHTATLLPNGLVLITGGYGGSAIGNLSSAELYDPDTETWSTTGSMTEGRSNHTATLLPNGKVLVAGGVGVQAVSSVELYDPDTGTWSTTGSMTTARYRHTATLLPNGKVLVAGGILGLSLPFYHDSAELYDPDTETWSTTGSMTEGRSNHTATLLPNGLLLVTGGINNWDGVQTLDSAELYDPDTETWAATGSMVTVHVAHTATLLPDNTVLVAGGYYNYAEIYLKELLPSNEPPVADAGADQIVECTTVPDTAVTLDGSSSSDLNNDPLSYAWIWDSHNANSVSPTISLPLGTTDISLVVNDGQVDSEFDTVSIAVKVAVDGFQLPLGDLVPIGEVPALPDKPFKAGRTLPLKLAFACSGSKLTDADVSLPPQIVALTREGDAPLDLAVEDLDAGKSADSGFLFRYSPEDGQWIYNLKTKGHNAGTYMITIKMPDGLQYNGAYVLK